MAVKRLKYHTSTAGGMETMFPWELVPPGQGTKSLHAAKEQKKEKKKKVGVGHKYKKIQLCQRLI